MRILIIQFLYTNAKMVDFSGIADETRSGLKPKYKHEASIHVLGGIFRKHKLMMFSGKLNTAGFKELAREFIIT